MGEITPAVTKSPLLAERARPLRPRGEGPAVAFIGLGSNLGDRYNNIQLALEMLSRTPGIQILKVSMLLETKPIGPVQDQPNFVNGVVAIETTRRPLDLLDELLRIEKSLGRVRAERWGPRTIDLDILLYGDERLDHPKLIVPHPEIENRPFVREAIEELRGNGIVPSPLGRSGLALSPGRGDG